ncbi:MAG: hypothetical protein GF368_01420 [Candidatus Aenigmarchaeota archaeon]|nr:hypothetical protein [Candidatus Aenigmarchaeota archaeon]
MNTYTKLLIGVLLLVVPLGMYAYELLNGPTQGIMLPVIGTIYLWNSLVTLIVGFVPGFVFLIGLFIVWLELDEIRIEKELKKEEEEEKEKEGKKSKKTKKSKKKTKKKSKKKK